METRSMITKANPEETAHSIVERILNVITIHAQDRRIAMRSLGRMVTISVQLHKADTTRAVGFKGQHINSMMRVVDMISRRSGVPIKLKLEEPIVGQPEPHLTFQGRENWDQPYVKELAEDMCAAILERPFDVTIHDGDDFQSVLEIAVHPSERHQLIEALTPILTPIFVAIGKALGRYVTLDLHKSEAVAAY